MEEEESRLQVEEEETVQVEEEETVQVEEEETVQVEEEEMVEETVEEMAGLGGGCWMEEERGRETGAVLISFQWKQKGWRGVNNSVTLLLGLS